MYIKEHKIIDKIKRVTKNIQGWLSDTEGILLFKLAKNLNGRGVIVEIGSWKGKSTVWLAKGSKYGKRVKVYAIDPHKGSTEHKNKYGNVWTFPEFMKNIKKARVNDLIVPVIKSSIEAVKNWKKPIELLFIDGAHEEFAVNLDFKLWYPHLINGGIIAFHDTTTHCGPKKVVENKICKSNNFNKVALINSITYARKVEQNSFIDRLRNIAIIPLLNLRHIQLQYNIGTPNIFKKILKIIISYF